MVVVIAVVRERIGVADKPILLDRDFEDIVLKGRGLREEKLSEERLRHSKSEAVFIVGLIRFISTTELRHFVLKVLQDG